MKYIIGKFCISTRDSIDPQSHYQLHASYSKGNTIDDKHVDDVFPRCRAGQQIRNSICSRPVINLHEIELRSQGTAVPVPTALPTYAQAVYSHSVKIHQHNTKLIPPLQDSIPQCVHNNTRIYRFLTRNNHNACTIDVGTILPIAQNSSSLRSGFLYHLYGRQHSDRYPGSRRTRS